MGHLYLLGLLIGLGVAIPIGPMNIEIIRRNLTFGLSSGLAFGVGIVSADLTYLLLLNLGLLSILIHSKAIMMPTGIIGSLVLLWFAYKAWRMTPGTDQNRRAIVEPLWRQTRDGYLLTLTSPFTILFWASMSSEIAVSSAGHHAMLPMVLGVMTGVTGWMLGFNLLLYFTRHRLSDRVMHILNRAGGLILFAFALFGLWHSIRFVIPA